MPDIDPKLMATMQGGQPQPGDGAPPSGPVSAPMSTPQPNEGEKMAAMSQVQMAVHILERTLSAFGSQSEEGQTVLDVLSKLGKKFGESQDKGRELIPSEIMNLVSSLPKGMAPPPGAGAGAPPGGGMPAPPMQ